MKPRAPRISTPLLSLLFAGLILISGSILPSRSLAQEQGIENLKQTGMAFRAVAKQVSPAVVFIKVEKEEEGGVMSPFGNNPFGDEFFRRFFGQPPQQDRPRQQPKHRSKGQGSGFIISPDGYIMTNNHVAGDADEVSVTLLDGREYKAKLIGTDPATDVAIIKIDESDLPFLKLGDSDKLEVGDWVLAFGNPFGLSHTLTAGIVSAKGRSGIGLNDYENFIQTDAAINPGNSGGPLVNLDGEVVGMNTAIFSRSGGSMGIGFAIPINMAQQVREQLVKHGKVTRGHLGVYIQDLNQDLADSFGLSDTKGILIAKVIEDSPAEKAGLQQGDVLLSLNSKPVGKVSEFRNQVAMMLPDTKVKIGLLRDGKEKTLTVTIGKQEDEAEVAVNKTGSAAELGMSLQTLTPELRGQLGYEDETGVLVTNVEPGSPAADAGIVRGSLILEVNRKPVTEPEQVQQALKENPGKPLLLLVRYKDGTRYLALKTE
ncbi:MAG TPA: DegQ family serine endoprotease [Geothermobacteraceae bacterium]|nr:DegQ family serine endoprotease [Geothermobacteraceae bacterium]